MCFGSFLCKLKDFSPYSSLSYYTIRTLLYESVQNAFGSKWGKQFSPQNQVLTNSLHDFLCTYWTYSNLHSYVKISQISQGIGGGRRGWGFVKKLFTLLLLHSTKKMWNILSACTLQVGQRLNNEEHDTGIIKQNNTMPQKWKKSFIHQIYTPPPKKKKNQQNKKPRKPFTLKHDHTERKKSFIREIQRHRSHLYFKHTHTHS